MKNLVNLIKFFTVTISRKILHPDFSELFLRLFRISVLSLFFIFLSFKLSSSMVFAIEELVIGGIKIPKVIGVERIQLNTSIKVDGKDYPFKFIDGMLLNDGKRTITIDGKNYTIEVKTTNIGEIIEINTSPYAYEFSKPGKIFDPLIRSDKTSLVSSEVNLSEMPKIVIFEDEVNNVNDVVFIPPLLERLDILDSQAPITNITGKKFLLSSRSPYRIFGKVILPEKSALILEESVTVVSALNSELNIKGTFVTTGPSTILQSAVLNVTENGILYLSGRALDTNIFADKGALVFLDNSQINDANLSFTNFVVIRNSTIRNLTVNGVYAVFILNSRISNLTIQNCRKVSLNQSVVVKGSVSSLSKTFFYHSNFNELIASDLSEVNIINGTLNNILAQRGAIVKLKNSKVDTLSVEDYSINYSFKSTIGTLSHLNGRYYLLETKTGKIIKK